MTFARFNPGVPLLPGTASSECSAVVVIPARDEAETLPACLQALACQADESGRTVSDRFEVLLLLNNCSDESVRVARALKQAHPLLTLHLIEREFPAEQANVGTARRLLMHTAWHRLSSRPSKHNAILSTDCDTTAHPHWFVRNLQALQLGADAVGGLICVKTGLESLPAGAQRAYTLDRRYQELIAELEALLDPQAGDPLPRHLDHFGASLACTCEIYARAGGIPVVPCLEDVAFVDALRRIDARLRHDPAVQVSTSARLRGRSQQGFANQLRLWAEIQDAATGQRVLSAECLQHRFTQLARLRRFFRGDDAAAWRCTPAQRKRLSSARQRQHFEGQFLAEIDCDAIIADTFQGARESDILHAIRSLSNLIASQKASRTNGDAGISEKPNSKDLSSEDVRLGSSL